MEALQSTEQVSRSGGSLRNKVVGLLAMTPCFIACDKGAETIVPAGPIATPSTTLSFKPYPKTVPIAKKPKPKQKAKASSKPKPKEKRVPTNDAFTNLQGDPSEIGPTVFLGDSLTKKLGEFGGKLNIEESLVVAKVGHRTGWLLERAHELANKGELSRFENAIVLIGSNDLGMGGKNNSAAGVFGRIEKTYQVLLGDTDYDGTPDIDGVDNVYGVTIPPFKGRNGLSAEGVFERVNEKRLRINELIKGSELPFQVIDLTATLGQGGIADNKDPDRISLIGPTGNEAKIPDGMHFPKKWLRLIYEKELRKNAEKNE